MRLCALAAEQQDLAKLIFLILTVAAPAPICLFTFATDPEASAIATKLVSRDDLVIDSQINDRIASVVLVKFGWYNS